MTKYFYRSAKLYRRNTIIMSEEWGKPFGSPTYNKNSPLYISEMLLEASRLLLPYTLQYPSRLTCNYAFDDENEARTRMQHLPYLYRVKFTKPNAVSKRLAYNLIGTMHSQVMSPSALQSLVDDYWAGNSITVAEIITESPLQIIKQI
jgi:hypothetical protein